MDLIKKMVEKYTNELNEMEAKMNQLKYVEVRLKKNVFEPGYISQMIVDCAFGESKFSIPLTDLEINTIDDSDMWTSIDEDSDNDDDSSDHDDTNDDDYRWQAGYINDSGDDD